MPKFSLPVPRILSPFWPLGTVVLVAAASAESVQVQITGPVEYNQINTGPLAAVHANDRATLTFVVNSANFVNSPNFPTRGYPIDLASLTLTMGSVTIGLESPYPVGQTPFFVLRNNDPQVDGFLISENVDVPFGVDTSVTNINLSFLATYKSPSVLPSLNILDALGNYSLAGISSFQWTLDSGPTNPVGLIYETMTISLAAEPCPADIDGDGIVDVDDLLAVITAWGACAPVCPADTDGDGIVDVDDLLVVIAGWGACP